MSLVTNGQVERVNRTLAPMIGKLPDIEIGKNWTKTLSEIEFSFINLTHKTTEETPSILLFGIPQRGKVYDPIAEYLNTDFNCGKRCLEKIRDKASQKMIERQNQVIAQQIKSEKTQMLMK